MKYSLLIVAVMFASLLTPFMAPHAHALSCLPVDMYLKDIVGKEDEVIIFEGTVTDQIMEEEYTAEVLTVTEVRQGYAESSLFAYHKKDATWGYFCNAGPAKEGDTSLYIASRDDEGTYTVHQRLALSDDLVTTLYADLEDAEIEGTLAEQTTEDRMNQIMTSIGDLFKKINTLFKEYVYLKMQ